LEDELWRLFGDRGRAFLGGWPEYERLEARLLSAAIERAQKKVEEMHFGQRKNTLEYDDVMNVQRDVIYRQRREILEGAELRETILDHTYDMVGEAVDRHCGAEISEAEWDVRGLYDELDLLFDLSLAARPSELEGKGREDLVEYLYDIAEKRYEQREQELDDAGVETRDAERQITLQIIDQKWVEHLTAMDYLREGVWMRGFEQKDPLTIYKKEAFDMFNSLLESIQDDMVNWMFHLSVRPQAPAAPRRVIDPTPMEETSPTPAVGNGNGRVAPSAAGGNRDRIGRNDPCPCGSGKKYKFCCLKTGAL
jgi:preprotein translocase subunit SecA